MYSHLSTEGRNRHMGSECRGCVRHETEPGGHGNISEEQEGHLLLMRCDSLTVPKLQPNKPTKCGNPHCGNH